MYYLKHKEVPALFVQCGEIKGKAKRLDWEVKRHSHGWTYVEDILEATIFRTELEAIDARHWYGIGVHVEAQELSHLQKTLCNCSTESSELKI